MTGIKYNKMILDGQAGFQTSRKAGFVNLWECPYSQTNWALLNNNRTFQTMPVCLFSPLFLPQDRLLAVNLTFHYLCHHIAPFVVSPVGEVPHRR